MGKVNRKKQQKNSTRPKTRKDIRKEQRNLKKQHRAEYHAKKQKPGKFVLKPAGAEVTNNQEISEYDAKKQIQGKLVLKPRGAEVTKKQEINSKENVKQVKNKQTDNASNRFRDMENEKKKQQKLEKEMQKHRSKQLLEANLEEDRNIKQLEKQLKLNKKKNKSVPQSFISEGLDYLLEVCDSENRIGIVAAEQLNDENDDFNEDFALMTNRPPTKTHKIEKTDNSDDSDDEHENFSDLDSCSEDDDKSDDTSESDDEPATNKKRKLPRSDSSNKKQRNNLADAESEDDGSSIGDEGNDSDNNSDDVEQSGTWEDIYGRTRGKDGTIITNNTGKYVPPAIRAKMEDQLSGDKERIEKLNRLKRQLKGLFNRLAEANMHSISTQLETLYMQNSRNDMNDTITNLMFDSLTSNVITPERLLIEHVSLITILHANVGTEVGAHFLQAIVRQFNSLFNADQEVEDKTLTNTVNVIAQLYNFKVFHSQLLYQLLSKLSDKFDEKSVECILAVLKSVGFSLRKDDPLALKDLILELQKRAANVPDKDKENLRVKYMLDILLAIKNNNMSKIPNYDTSYSEHLKKLQKNFVRAGNYVTQLNISLDDLLQAEERGKWWIVGSAWTGGLKEETPAKTKTVKTAQYSQKLLDLARKQRMNTDTRRDVFCILMSAEDYLDAFEKLLHLNLKNQDREIIHVILHCCLQETNYNPYYAVLAQRFCDHDRKFQMAIKYSIWDKLKALKDCSPSQIANLAKLLSHLFLERGLPISTLKVMVFRDMDKLMLRFIRQILLGILLCEDAGRCTAVFQNIALSEKLKKFRESLRLFIRHLLLSNLEVNLEIPENQKVLLQSRADMVEKVLTVKARRTIF